jgi:polyhydroxyalkanoate synthase
MSSDKRGEAPVKNLPEPQEYVDVWSRIFTNGLEALRATTEKQAGKSMPPAYDPTAPVRAIAEFQMALFLDPVHLVQAQMDFSRDWMRLWQNAAVRAIGQEAEPIVVPERNDRRFNDPAWTELPAFDSLKQAYLLMSRQIPALIARARLDPETRVRADFYARQFLNAIAPSNFAMLNPEVLRKAFETGGLSLLSGVANMLEDMASPTGMVQRRSVDDFKIGVTIAATPGKVVFQNEMMQLLQYSPTTETVYHRPILYIPPLVNKFYLIDLQPKSSLVRWLVEQGHTVFLVSWVNPGPEMAHKSIADYVNSGPIAALEAIERETGARTVDMFAFCMGGLLLGIAAAILAARDEADRIGSITTIGTQFDSSHSGEWGTFYEPRQIEALERHVRAAGAITSHDLQGLFSAVRANDLIWQSVVDHYLLDRPAPASDLLFWFADGAHIPRNFILDYVKLILKENLLCQPGKLVVDSVPIDLSKVTAPVTIISLKEDHVAFWQATYAATRLFGGPVRFILGGSGHNAGLVNPPSANKHGYWINDHNAHTPTEWLAGAEQKPGSWWTEWEGHLAALNKGKRIVARIPGGDHYHSLEDAPGSYVFMR